MEKIDIMPFRDSYMVICTGGGLYCNIADTVYDDLATAISVALEAAVSKKMTLESSVFSRYTNEVVLALGSSNSRILSYFKNYIDKDPSLKLRLCAAGLTI